jgi:hypothetical protein
MRELHGYHGEHRRHAHDAATDAPATRAHDGPKHASHDSPKLRMLLDPEARKTERLKYQQKVEAAESEYAGKHAKPKLADQGRAPEQFKSQEQKPRDAPPGTRDQPAPGIARRRLEEPNQAEDVAAREKPRFRDKALNFWTATSGLALTIGAEQFHLIPQGLASEISNAIGVAALGIIWRQGERTENRDGNRLKD